VVGLGFAQPTTCAIKKPMICIYMDKSIKMIMLSLNSLGTLSEFKKNHTYGKNENFIYLIVNIICLSGISVPQEDALSTLFT
jgi:hypothetical protein